MYRKYLFCGAQGCARHEGVRIVIYFHIYSLILSFSLREKGLLRLYAFAIFMTFLSACTTQPYYQANAIYQDVHDGGSIVEFSPDEQVLVSGGWEGRVSLWSLPDGKPLRDWQAHSDTVNGLVFTSGNQLISAGYDAHLIRWSLTGEKLQDKRLPSAVMHMIFAPDRGWLVTGHVDGRVMIWSEANFDLLDQQRHHSDTVAALAYDPVNGMVASSSVDRQVLLWRVGHAGRSMQSPGSYARTLVFSADGKYLYGGGWFDLLRWDTRTGSLTASSTGHNGIIKSLDRTPGGDLASISRQTDSSVYLLDAETGMVRQRYQPHELCGGYIRVSPSGRYWATTGDDASVRYWDQQRLRLVD